jgi:8-amino-7-oxononanoate synthase
VRGRVFLVTESLFSMDGDVAPLDRYADLAVAHGANLIVDDAHATGVYGEVRGSGLVERFGVEDRVLAVVSTCGKALGVSGAFVSGPAVLREYLVNRGRPFIFTTAPAPLLLHAIDAALDLVEARPERRRELLDRAARLRERLRAAGLDCLRSDGPIVPVVLGSPRRAVRVAEAVRRRGYDVRAIRPPAVPPRTARLRVSVHADHTEDAIDGVAAAIVDAVAESPPGDPPS